MRSIKGRELLYSTLISHKSYKYGFMHVISSVSLFKIIVSLTFPISKCQIVKMHYSSQFSLFFLFSFLAFNRINVMKDDSSSLFLFSFLPFSLPPTSSRVKDICSDGVLKCIFKPLKEIMLVNSLNFIKFLGQKMFIPVRISHFC